MIRVLVILLFSTTCFSQTLSGIYFTIKTPAKGNCEHQINMLLEKKKICVSKKPIIGIEAIEYVTDILYDSKLKKNYFNVGLSSEAVGTLNKIYNSMPSSQFLFVVDNFGIGRFTLDTELHNRIMRLGLNLDLEKIKTIHAMLKKQQVGG